MCLLLSWKISRVGGKACVSIAAYSAVVLNLAIFFSGIEKRTIFTGMVRFAVYAAPH